MEIEMKPLHDGKRTCLQDLIATVAGHWNRPSDLMFSQSWGGSFNPSAGVEAYMIGDRFEAQFETALDELDRYHGIELRTYNGIGAESVLKHAEESWQRGLPTIIYLDHYWTPWLGGYQFSHREHYVLLTGINREKNTLICIDTFGSQGREELPVTDFLQGSNGSCGVFRFHSNVEEVDVAQWADRLRRKLWPEEGLSVFDSIHRFADALEDPRFDMRREVAPAAGETVWVSPIIWNIIHAERGRYCFQAAASYIGERYSDSRFKELAAQLSESVSEWIVLRNMLLKHHYLSVPSSAGLLEKAIDKLHRTAELERKAAERFLHQTSSGQTWPAASGISHDGGTEAVGRLPEGSLELPAVRIDLAAFFNNTGFGGLHSGATLTCMDGGEHFLLEDGGDPPPWNDERCRPFAINEPVRGNGDNVICLGQSIPVQADWYTHLALVGCAEWGNYKDTVTLVYEYGTDGQAALALTDWNADQPVYGEQIVWSGKTVWYEGDKPHVLAGKKLYVQAVPLKFDKRLVSMTLPICPNLHVFACNLYIHRSKEGNHVAGKSDV